MPHVQVTVPSLQSRSDHSATAFNLSPGLTEVTLFGGYSEWPSNPKSLDDVTPIANTTVLRFGEYTSCVLYCHVMRWKHRLLLCVMSQSCSSRGRELIIVSDYYPARAGKQREQSSNLIMSGMAAGSQKLLFCPRQPEF